LEFGILGHLLEDPTIEQQARKAVDSIWKLRSKTTGLFGRNLSVFSFRPAHQTCDKISKSC